MTAHHSRQQLGASLIELVITIVIISIALVGILGVVNLSVRHSADPVVQQQAIAIAESYLEEILLLPVTDPDGSNTGENRATFDNVEDYDGLHDTGATDQNGNAISGLENYVITVSVSDQIISAVTMKAVTVSVVRTGTQTISLSGYKANF